MLNAHAAQQVATCGLPAVAKISAPAAGAMAIAACDTTVPEWISTLCRRRCEPDR